MDSVQQVRLIVMLACAAVALGATAVFALGGDSDTAFTYQGRLLDGGDPADGLFDLEFSLWDASNGGGQIGGTQALNNVTVDDGLFTVEIDFGADAFDNSDRWLEIAVDGFTLDPRQPITRAPYSIQTRGIFVDQDQRVFVGRQNSVTDSEYFGFNAPVNSGYGGMYISTDGEDGWPFYGYAAGGASSMWHYYDGSTGKWHLYNSGTRMTVTDTGNIGIGTTTPDHALHVVSTTAPAIFGQSTDGVGKHYGVEGVTDSDVVFAAGVRGFGNHTGVVGEAESTGATGVFGRTLHPTSGFAGVWGWASSPTAYGVFSAGDYGGSGAKYFVQPHPYDPSKEIRFVCLEGNESGTYFRGSTLLVDGRAVIDVPEEFRLVTETDGLTVQVTARGPNAGLWVETETLNQIVVRGNGNVKFNYFVNGVRRGFADVELIRENRSYVTTVRGVPYGNQYRDGHRRILVENGILNPDFTPNETTAAMMGWELRDPDPDELARATSGATEESK